MFDSLLTPLSQGNDATVTLKNGEQFTGIFSGASLEAAKPQYILKMVRRTRPPTHQQANGDVESPSEYAGEGEDHMMVIDKEDTVDLHVPDVAPITAPPVQNGQLLRLALISNGHADIDTLRFPYILLPHRYRDIRQRCVHAT